MCGLQDTHAVTGPAPFYMPTVEEALESVAKAKIISTIDLNKGYYQVKCISFEIMSVLGCCLPSSLVNGAVLEHGRVSSGGPHQTPCQLTLSGMGWYILFWGLHKEMADPPHFLALSCHHSGRQIRKSGSLRSRPCSPPRESQSRRLASTTWSALSVPSLRRNSRSSTETSTFSKWN